MTAVPILPPRAVALLARIVEEHAVAAIDIMSKRRQVEIVRARYAFWAGLSGLGWTCSEIARRCGSERTCVSRALRKNGEAT